MFSLENTRFFLGFAVGTTPDPVYKRYEIAEPTGFDGARFKLQQEEGRLGRDVFFAPVDLEFNKQVSIRGLTHEFDRLVNTYTSRAFEGNVQFIIEVSTIEYVIGQLDFSDAVTDLTTYFKCNIIQENAQAIIKRRADIKVDLFSDTDINGNPISSLVPNKILLQAQPIFQESTWEVPADPVIGSFGEYIIFNPCRQVVTSNVADTLSPSSNQIVTSSLNSFGLEDFAMIEAKNTITSGVLALSNGVWDFDPFIDSLTLIVRVGADTTVVEENTTLIYQDTIPTTAAGFSLNIDIPIIKRGERLFVYLASFQTASPNTFTSLDINFSGLATSVSSVVDGVRLWAAMRQVIRSISGTVFQAPRWDVDGEFYNQFVLKGNQIRQIEDLPMTMSLNDILEYLPEVQGDYKILPDGSIFFGIESDFYNTTEESGEFEMYPNSVFKQTINPKYAVNKLSYNYTKFEAGSNTLQPDSLEGIHTETQWAFENQFVENNKDITVGFVRDWALLEKVRKEFIIVTEDAAASEDEDIFIIDCIIDTVQFTEYLPINHTFSPSETEVTWFNDGSFNFSLMGLEVGDIIGCSIPYIASLEITEISERSLVCDVLAVDTPLNGIYITDMGYTLEDVLTNRTDEGFFNISNTNLPDGFSNMLYSPRRNLIKYYGSYLKTASKAYPQGKLKNTFYKNNPDIYFNFAEGGDFYAGQVNEEISINIMPPAIVTPFLVETEVICAFSQFWNLVTSVREDDGYITVKTNKGTLIRIYPIELDYDWGKFLLTIKGELKIT